MLIIVGAEADAKARRSAQAVLDRTRRLLREGGPGRLRRTHVDILEFGSLFRQQPPARRGARGRDVAGRAAPSRKALELFAREIAPAGTGWARAPQAAAPRPADTRAIDQAVRVPAAQAALVACSGDERPARRC
ncbi:MAG: hypothetical protein U1F25_17570 [Rubrivivax sp.]